ncbi:MAG: HAD-IB family phosphatase [Alphaproteobacteria bacterium]|nr:HAD-IB family phosphatase [Alphaproteobacteria bacterium]
MASPGGSGPTLAVFDFDGTLTRRDTLLPWLAELRGWRRTLIAAARAGLAAPLRPRRDGADTRTAIKQRLLRQLLTGVEQAAGVAAAQRLARRLSWRASGLDALQRHRQAGDRVLIATGAADFVARTLLAERFGDRLEVIGTTLELDRGRFTGRMLGANCVRRAKADRLRNWLVENGPFHSISGYGNAPHDLPMLALCDHRTMI